MRKTMPREAFFEACASDDWRTRKWVIENASPEAETIFFEAIVGLLSDPVRDVASAAATLLKTIKNKRIDQMIIPYLSGNDQEKELALSALENTQLISAQRDALKILEHDAEPLRSLAVRMLKNSTDRTIIHALINLLSHRQKPIARAAASALCGIRDPATLGVLGNSLLYSSDSQQRALAAVALGGTKDSGALRALVRALADTNDKVRLHALESLRTYRDPKIYSTVVSLLVDENQSVRREAACYLKGIRDYPVPERLLENIEREKSEHVRIALHDSLNWNSDQAVQEVFERNAQNDPSSGVRIACIGGFSVPCRDQAIPILLQLLRHDTFPEVRAVAAEKLRFVPEAGATNALAHAASHDSHPHVRACALRSLQFHHSPWHDHLVRLILNDLSWRDQNDAVREEALNYINTDSSAEGTATIVTFASKEEVPRLRRKAIGLLATRSGLEVVPALTRALRDTDPSVRCAALSGLINRHVERIVDLLVHLIFRDPSWEVRLVATQALKEHRDEIAQRALLYALRDESIMVRQSAALALQNTNDLSALRELVDIIKEGNSKTCFLAGMALQKCQNQRIAEELLELTRHENSRIVASARYALQSTPFLFARQQLQGVVSAGNVSRVH